MPQQTRSLAFSWHHRYTVRRLMQVVLAPINLSKPFLDLQVSLAFVMSDQSLSTRQRLLRSALNLFLAQGIANATTRSIAEAASVNEVTLFRHFGSKNGLLLAILEECAPFQQIGATLTQWDVSSHSPEQALRHYINRALAALERVPALVRSIIGEADQYPVENRQALGRGLQDINHAVATYIEGVFQQAGRSLVLPPSQVASLLNSAVLGYAILTWSSDGQGLWQSRAAFIDDLVQLVLDGVQAMPSALVQVGSADQTSHGIADLAPPLVHEILQRARKAGGRDYAIAYVLFATGLSVPELVGLTRSQQICTAEQHLLQIVGANHSRTVPVNQWIMGKRYGSYRVNPLTKWLKGRKDDNPALFLNAADQALTTTDLETLWQSWSATLTTPRGTPPAIAQVQDTWIIDMLRRGMTREAISLLTGLSAAALAPYDQRARVITALEEAARLDQKNA